MLNFDNVQKLDEKFFLDWDFKDFSDFCKSLEILESLKFFEQFLKYK